MYRLLIVDDEIDIADGLFDRFSRNDKFDLEVYRVYDGKSALMYFAEMKIDILITDIHMPGMSGLQLLEEVHADWPMCKAIVLTGHDKFEYIYEATREPHATYLLKTEGTKAISDAVCKAVDELDEQAHTHELEEAVNHHIKEWLPAMQRDLLKELLGNGSVNLTGQFEDLSINLDVSLPVLIIVGRIPYSCMGNSLYKNVKISLIIKEIAFKHFSQRTNICFTDMGNATFVWLMQKKQHEESTYDMLFEQARSSVQSIQTECMEKHEINLSFIVDKQMTQLAMAASRFDSLMLMLSARMQVQAESVLIQGAPQEKNEVQGRIAVNEIKKLAAYLECGDKSGFMNQMDLIKSIFINTDLGNQIGMEAFYSLVLVFISYMGKRDISEEIAGRTGFKKLTHVEEYKNWHEVDVSFKALASELFKAQKSLPGYSIESVIDRLHKYIRENLSQDLSLSKLAGIINYNPSYLARIYKKTTGGTILSYIQNARMEKVKELLASTDMSLQNISESIGCSSTSYFAQLFRRETGISPTEYRRNANRILFHQDI